MHRVLWASGESKTGKTTTLLKKQHKCVTVSSDMAKHVVLYSHSCNDATASPTYQHLIIRA